MTKANGRNPVGASVYSKTSLLLYDALVHWFSNNWIWNCQRFHLANYYQRSFSSEHLEIGIGSGRLLGHLSKEYHFDRLVIGDVNDDCLAFASKVLGKRLHTAIRLNLLERSSKWPDVGRFGSIGFNYVLHCLPIDFAAKLRIMDQLIDRFLSKEGVLVGSTILPGCRSAWLSNRVMRFYNRKGIFSNENDSLPELKAWIQARGNQSEWKIVGDVAIFRVIA
jgi:hypothetical protein